MTSQEGSIINPGTFTCNLTVNYQLPPQVFPVAIRHRSCQTGANVWIRWHCQRCVIPRCLVRWAGEIQDNVMPAKKSAGQDSDAAPLIRMRDVSKFFGAFQALDEVSLEIGTSEKVVICGPSGSGKSTLIRCINRLEQHDAGEIMIDGVAVDDSAAARAVLRNNVGMVFQQFNLFPHLSILDNLTLGPMRARGLTPAAARELAEYYLERVRIPEQIQKFPDQLSGGQQQRVAIARALCMEPRIMLFDEPTSALDPEMIAEVLDVIGELAATGMTMIVVTHEMGFAGHVADKMVFMDHGRIVEMAPPKRFFSEPESDRCKIFLQQILRN